VDGIGAAGECIGPSRCGPRLRWSTWGSGWQALRRNPGLWICACEISSAGDSWRCDGPQIRFRWDLVG